MLGITDASATRVKMRHADPQLRILHAGTRRCPCGGAHREVVTGCAEQMASANSRVASSSSVLLPTPVLRWTKGSATGRPARSRAHIRRAPWRGRYRIGQVTRFDGELGMPDRRTQRDLARGATRVGPGNTRKATSQWRRQRCVVAAPGQINSRRAASVRTHGCGSGFTPLSDVWRWYAAASGK